MTAITMIQIDKAELQNMLDTAAARAVQQAAEQSGERWGVNDLAAYLSVSARTVINWREAGKLPPRDGTKWRKADVIRWERERSDAKKMQTDERKTA